MRKHLWIAIQMVVVCVLVCACKEKPVEPVVQEPTTSGTTIVFDWDASIALMNQQKETMIATFLANQEEMERIARAFLDATTPTEGVTYIDDALYACPIGEATRSMENAALTELVAPFYDTYGDVFPFIGTTNDAGWFASAICGFSTYVIANDGLPFCTIDIVFSPEPITVENAPYEMIPFSPNWALFVDMLE